MVGVKHAFGLEPEVEADIGVTREPTVIFGLVGVEIVEDDVNIAAAMRGGNPLHEVKAAATLTR